MELVSIITVCKNSEKTIGKTIESILFQTYEEIECIFIDGKSEDNTNSIIKKYKKKLNDRKINVIHVSEQDDGIYYAMNKGISLASGDWVYFLNSDDRLAETTVLERIFSTGEQYKEKCLYGNTINTISGRCFVRKGLPLDVIYYRMPFGHQALFVRRDTIRKYYFDTAWPRMADFDQFLRMYLNGESFKYLDINIAEFNLTGVSQRNGLSIAVEREQIQKKNNVDNRCRLKRYFRNLGVILIKDNKLFYKMYVEYIGNKQRLMR